MGMADEVKKALKPGMPDEKAAKEGAKATLLAMTKTDAQKAAAVKTPSAVEVKAKEDRVVAAPKGESKKAPVADVPKAEPAKAEASEIKTETPKAESKKEADPNKEFVDGIMTEMALKGASKKRLIKMLGEQYNFDKHKVMFRLKRALIGERYAAAHAEAGH
jgi:hypothetical protein